MSKTLVVVESPGKVNNVQSYLGDKYIVMASVGHIIDLQKSCLSVNVNDNFKPLYVHNSDKQKVIGQLKTNMKKSNSILLATDKDREGEMIGWSILYVLGIDTKNAKRLSFNSITKDEIQNSIKSPNLLDFNLINAQKARRILDRILGYYLTPLLWKQVQPKISTGRVQAVVTRLIVDKENDINDFIKSKLVSQYHINGQFKYKNETYKATLYEITKCAISKFTLSQVKVNNKKLAEEIMSYCSTTKYKVSNILYSESKKSSGKPFTTSSLQQEASRKFGFTVKRTMSVAQTLYEAGLITYMRTDSVMLSTQALKEIQKYVLKNYGDKYHKYVQYKCKTKNAQEAHEAIRPTIISRKDIIVNNNGNKKIGYDEVKLYSLIWKRTIASQMTEAIYDVTTIHISLVNNLMYIFQSVFNTIKFAGFMAVYDIQTDETDTVNMTNVPKLNSEMHTNFIEALEDYNKPPVRYNEASLVAKLEPDNLNIGRPATYASIISKIQDNKYVEKSNLDGLRKDTVNIIWDGKKLYEKKSSIVISNEKDKLIPTMLGQIVTKYLIERFPVIMSYKFTAHMEDKLDEVANGNMIWHKVLKDFYDEFYPKVNIIKTETPLIKNVYEKILGKYPNTNEDVIVTMGYNGPLVKLSETKYKIGPIKKPLTLETITLDAAVKILEYPKMIGKMGNAHVLLKKGEHGYYIFSAGKTVSVPDEKITLSDVKKLMEKKDTNVLKQFTEGTKTYKVLNGQYGNYINITDSKSKKYRMNVPLKNIEIDVLTIEKIKELVTAKNNRKGRKFNFKKKK